MVLSLFLWKIISALADRELSPSGRKRALSGKLCQSMRLDIILFVTLMIEDNFVFYN